MSIGVKNRRFLWLRGCYLRKARINQENHRRYNLKKEVFITFWYKPLLPEKPLFMRVCASW